VLDSAAAHKTHIVSGMDRDEVRALLARVADGVLPADEALEELVGGPLAMDHGHTAGFTDLGFARLDTHRALRTGDPEVVYGAGKTPAEIVALLRALHSATGDRPAVVTRLRDDAIAAIRAELPEALVDEVARCALLGELPPTRGTVCVVTAGTSDAPVAAEAAFIARAFGAEVDRVNDVGVAGLHRLLAVRAQLELADCLVVVAGMEGALPSAIGGLVGAPIVAVPTSVGYGAAFEGLAALLGMLTSCAPGVTVVNIDNGFGAGLFAARVARRTTAAGRSQ
jgi:pyridinium-3,5-biscarboxylic acid mononucleotide synthase